MRQVNVNITRNELTALRRNVAPWEVPFLQAIHGPQNIEVRGEVDNDKPYPTSAASEYARLEQVYGSVEGNEKSYAAELFGVGQAGHMALGDIIRRAIAAHRAKPVPTAPPPDRVNPDAADVIDSDMDAIETPTDLLTSGQAKEAAESDPIAG